MAQRWRNTTGAPSGAGWRCCRQAPAVPEGLTVAEVVTLARFPHQGLLGRVRAEDRRAVRDALEQTGLAAMADRLLESLSGGEHQRVWIAATLAQGTELRTDGLSRSPVPGGDPAVGA